MLTTSFTDLSLWNMQYLFYCIALDTENIRVLCHLNFIKGRAKSKQNCSCKQVKIKVCKTISLTCTFWNHCLLVLVNLN